MFCVFLYPTSIYFIGTLAFSNFVVSETVYLIATTRIRTKLDRRFDNLLVPDTETIL